MKTYTEYLLDCLAEEAAEIVQAVTKAHRFGLDDVYEKRGFSNRAQLALEIDDLNAVVHLLRQMHQLPAQSDENLVAKMVKVGKWAAYSHNKGLLDLSHNSLVSPPQVAQAEAKTDTPIQK